MAILSLRSGRSLIFHQGVSIRSSTYSISSLDKHILFTEATPAIVENPSNYLG